MTDVNWIAALVGGMLIGLSATILLAFDGYIAGISGILNQAIRMAIHLDKAEPWRWLFIVGMLMGGILYEYGVAPHPTPQSSFAPVAMILGGLLVGVGTRMGNGCTSGHGVCGLGRLSMRSLVAVLTFMVTAVVTVLVVRHGLKLG